VFSRKAHIDHVVDMLTEVAEFSLDSVMPALCYIFLIVNWFITSAKACLCLCLSICLLTGLLKVADQIFVKFCGMAGHNPRIRCSF